MVTSVEFPCGKEARTDGIHDLGGMHGFGRVPYEPDEPAFHAPWEGRVHGMVLALAAAGVLRSGLRRTIERLDPARYLSSPYYERWLAALETRLDEAGTLPRAQLEARLAAPTGPGRPSGRADPALPAKVRALLRPFPVDDPPGPDPRFGLGERVRVRRHSHAGHTRCPRYVRGVTGTVERILAAQPLPDPAPGQRRPVEPCYTVAFPSTHLWGEPAEPATILVDLWESYLEPAGGRP